MNIFAYTAHSDRPPYISLNQDAAGVVHLTVRSLPYSGQVYGDSATIELPLAELQALSERLAKWLSVRAG